MDQLATVLAALYLRGGPRPPGLRRAAWPEVLKALRRAAVGADDAAEALRDAGMWAEALILDSPGLLAWAAEQVASEAALTAADGCYPHRWLRVLGPSAPPALWRSGQLGSSPCVSVVGSRAITARVRRFCREVGREAAQLGLCVISGGAYGCDSAAVDGAVGVGGHAVNLLPHGLPAKRSSPACTLTVCGPGELFSQATAMERNALIYAFSSHTIIGAARFKEGGTWHGALHAARSRLSSLLLRRSGDLAMRSLAALGGAWIDEPCDLARAIRCPSRQELLFDPAV